MDRELKEMLESMDSKFDNRMKAMDSRFNNKLESMDEKLNTIQKELANNKEEMKVMNYKLDRHTEKIENLDLRLRNAEANIRKDVRKLSDENETIIEVLRQRDFLSR